MNTEYIQETERQSNKFNYKVEQVPMALQIADKVGISTKYIANVRTDTNEVLGVVTERYEVLQNDALFDSAESVFKSVGFANYKRNVICTNNGARVRAIYDFPDFGFKLNNGNDLTFRVKVQNSFDGSLKASFQVGLVRLICTNGLALNVASIGMTRKHTQQLDANVISESFKRCTNAFVEGGQFFNKMIGIKVSQSEGDTILLNLEKQKVMSERMREGILSIWTRPTYAEDSERNLFNLYNSVTQHLTHSVESKRFELSERVNTGVLQAFTKAVKANSIEGLIATRSLN